MHQCSLGLEDKLIRIWSEAKGQRSRCLQINTYLVKPVKEPEHVDELINSRHQRKTKILHVSELLGVNTHVTCSLQLQRERCSFVFQTDDDQ